MLIGSHFQLDNLLLCLDVHFVQLYPPRILILEIRLLLPPMLRDCGVNSNEAQLGITTDEKFLKY